MTDLERFLADIIISIKDIKPLTDKYGRKNARPKVRIVKKPKVYYWDRSAIKEQINQLVFEQRFNDMCDNIKENIYVNTRTNRNKKTSKKNNACNRTTR